VRRVLWIQTALKAGLLIAVFVGLCLLASGDWEP